MTSNTRPTCLGRERSCTQCGAVYRAPRSTSRFCSPACRQKAHRGTAPTGGAKAGPSSFSLIGKVLVAAGLAGPIGPVSRRDATSTVYGLTVPSAHAVAELRQFFNVKGWGYLSDEEFSEALTADGIRAYSTASPEAAERKRWQSRQNANSRRAQERAVA